MAVEMLGLGGGGTGVCPTDASWYPFSDSFASAGETESLVNPFLLGLFKCQVGSWD